jgi:hypothetical protein
MPRREWSPNDITLLMASGTACTCLLLLVGGTVIGVLRGIITAELIGTISGLGAGGGLLGLALILYLIIKTTIPKNRTIPPRNNTVPPQENSK